MRVKCTTECHSEYCLVNQLLHITKHFSLFGDITLIGFTDKCNAPTLIFLLLICFIFPVCFPCFVKLVHSQGLKMMCFCSRI